ncbi:MAG: hypothetical protein ACODAJ_14055 [Planctomycetota bacterium]
MTAQAHDLVTWHGEAYDLCGANGDGLFDPVAHGLTPAPMCTACWRGYVCHYAVEEGCLILDDLMVTNAKTPAGREPVLGPAIRGVEPEPEGESFFNCVYRGVGLPVAYSGGMLLGRGFIRELYVHMGFHPAWKFERVVELVFADGRLERHRDLSDRMREVRETLSDDPLGPGADASMAEVRKWIEATFSLYYENP